VDASTCPTIDPGSDAAIGRAGVVRRDPRQRPRAARAPSAADIALAGTATHKVTRLIAEDGVTSFIRAPFTRYQEPAGHGELEEAARGIGLGLAIRSSSRSARR
jgi:Protein of unknown function (DUF1360)